MSRVREIRREIKLTRKEMLEQRGIVAGACEFSIFLAINLGGDVYITSQTSKYGLDHKVAIVPFGRRSGKIVDVTEDNPIIGTISDFNSVDLTEVELAGIYNIGEWKRLLRFSK